MNLFLKKILECPQCKSALAKSVSGFRCKKCAKTFSKKNGVHFFNTATESVQKKESETFFWKNFLKKNSFKSYDRKVYAAFMAHEYSEVFEKTLPKKSRGIAVDAGCGAGVSTGILSGLGFKVIAFDLSPELALAAKTFNKGKKSAFFLVADAESMPLKRESADVVFFGGVLHHFQDYGKVLAEASRVLKKGGIFIAIEPNWFNFPKQLKFFVAKLRKRQSENEYPISPIALKKNLSKNFQNLKIFFPEIDHSKRKTFSKKAFGGIGKLFPKILNSEFFAIFGEKK